MICPGREGSTIFQIRHICRWVTKERKSPRFWVSWKKKGLSQWKGIFLYSNRLASMGKTPNTGMSTWHWPIFSYTEPCSPSLLPFDNWKSHESKRFFSKVIVQTSSLMTGHRNMQLGKKWNFPSSQYSHPGYPLTYTGNLPLMLELFCMHLSRLTSLLLNIVQLL